MKAPRIEDYYQSADQFFQNNLPVGLTYDDISLATLYSDVLPRQTNLGTRLSESLELQIPIISSDMDTVTESKMAIKMALNGGLGLIHYNMTDEKQVREVARVKNHIHGFIQEPIKVEPNQKIGEVMDRIADRGYGFSTFPVVDDNNKLLGLLPGRVVKARYANRLVSEAMTPRDQVYTLNEKEITKDPIKTADKFFTDHLGIHKLLVVDDEDRLRGLFTLSDIERIDAESQQSVKPARDSHFRLMCGAAISAHRKPDGELDRERIINHVGKLVDEGVDTIAVSTAHGFSKGVGDTIRMLRGEFADLTLIAGNVTSAEGVEFLADAGANTIKIGQGPGSICTTRIVAGVGIPQMTALYCASIAARKKGVAILADGGITKSGDMVKALTLANGVMCGSLLAGCNEAPGQIIEINGKQYKQYRGMGSSAAMKDGSASRYGHDRKDIATKAAAEGIEALKESVGSLSGVLRELVGGIQSGMGYLGAADLAQLREKARYIRVSPAGQKESAPHDVITVKTSDSSADSSK
ncbi:IMP dehydrogenase [Coraliomargarita sp. SDUM461003]|uniref:IMP dehydrogenase n=2 Tax=Thalassobacterium TaxID=3410851 RepID=A0ABU1AZ21_9BACT|nr:MULTISPECIES: IMP dehydrogenase [unclassified Coraliomargarita]MDQ8196161.1 IMP dehydrogenase [Coraliomargarita sp. SDUM461004]MDQ8209408.1 IMP dehydrogenase [Coraliomargarita sp. SDUM461003]